MRDVKTTHRFGSHLSVAGGMTNAIREARRLGFDSVQVFVKNQRQWKATPLDPGDLAAWREARGAAFGPVVAHATYLINLASADDALRARSVAALVEELHRCDVLDIPYLVLHPGAAVGIERDAGVRNVAASLNEIHTANTGVRATVCLETTAGQGSTLGRTFEELGAIIALLRQPQRVGVCVDTCHVFAAGYDIRDEAVYQAMIDEAERTVGLSRIRCWHLNDSRGDVGSHLDRHEHIGRGKIGKAGFAHVLRDERFAGLPMILETPKETDERGREWDVVNLRALRAIVGGVARPSRAGTGSAARVRTRGRAGSTG